MELPIQKRSRGRPPKFDRAEVLDRAIEVFLANGFAATSLDDLARAMGMNRPSIYNAFGNKESVYRRALARFVDQLRETVGAILFSEPRLVVALTRFYQGALDVYFADQPARGCFVFCTAPVEGVVHPDIADDIRAVLGELDQTLEKRFEMAQAAGEFPEDLDCALSAQLAQAVLHSIALRARAGQTRDALEHLADYAVRQLCPRRT